MKFRLLTPLLLMQLVSFSQKNCRVPYASVHKFYNSSLIDSLKVLKFETKNKKKYIPGFIKKNLKCWNKGEFRIANPNKPYNAGDAVIKNWPRRRLNYLGLNASYIIVSYDHGGYGHHQHILIFNLVNKNIKEVYNLHGNVSSAEELIGVLTYLKDQTGVFINSREF